MESGCFFVLDIGWLNAWIPSVAMVLLQFLCMVVFKEGGKRAVDTSWYDSKAKRNAMLNTTFQVLFIVMSVFVPLRMGTHWLTVGAVIYFVAVVLFAWSFYSYATAERGKLITTGIYRYSRNPMYTVFTLAFVGVTISTSSAWLLLLLIPYVWSMHLTILSEEQYCEKTYGDEFRDYKKRVPRYLLFF